MIIEAVLVILMSLISFVFGLVTLPAFPLEFQNAINGVIPLFTIPIGLLRTVMGDNFFIALMVATIVVLSIVPTLRLGIRIYKLIRG